MRMTKIFAMALAALTIASCSKEEIGGSNNGTGGEEINAPTYATFKFNIGGASSRAVGVFDPAEKAADDDADAKIGSMQLLIFNAATQGLEHNSTLTVGQESETVLLTAGRKKIFFVANSDNLTDYSTAILPANFEPGVKTLAHFYALNFSAGTPQQVTVDKTAATRDFDLSPLYKLSNETANKEAGLPMSNTNEVTYTLKAGVSKEQAEATGGTAETNTFSIQLHYMVAKARLVLKKNEVLSDGDAVSKPVIKDVKYSIRNLARVTNYIQNVPTAGNPQSYYYSNTFADVAAFNAQFDNASNINVAATVKDATPAGNYLYVPENNHSMLSRGQSSYFAIKATFEPVVINKVECPVNKVAYTYAKLATADVSRNYIYTTKEFKGIPAGSYFLNLTLLQEAVWMEINGRSFPTDGSKDVEAAALVTTSDYMSFEGGNSYYRVDIGTGAGADTKYGVLRSNKYEATINKITGPGVPTEGDLITDPANPVSAGTYIDATILPAAWTPLSQTADL